jgi:hypothetical protein
MDDRRQRSEVKGRTTEGFEGGRGKRLRAKGARLKTKGNSEFRNFGIEEFGKKSLTTPVFKLASDPPRWNQI